MFKGRHFNPYIRWEGIKKDILKRVTVNGATGNNWIFKRFNKLQADNCHWLNKFQKYNVRVIFLSLLKKMNFIEFEASEENTDNQPLVLSDDEDEIT